MFFSSLDLWVSKIFFHVFSWIFMYFSAHFLYFLSSWTVSESSIFEALLRPSNTMHWGWFRCNMTSLSRMVHDERGKGEQMWLYRGQFQLKDIYYHPFISLMDKEIFSKVSVAAHPYDEPYKAAWKQVNMRRTIDKIMLFVQYGTFYNMVPKDCTIRSQKHAKLTKYSSSPISPPCNPSD